VSFLWAAPCKPAENGKPQIPKPAGIACFAAIGQKYGCITTGLWPHLLRSRVRDIVREKINGFVMSDAKNNKNKWIHIRVNGAEHKTICDKYALTTCRKLSEYARRVLLDKAVTVNQRNQSLDDFMAEMIRLRNELNGIGNNFNQAVKKLHSFQQIGELKTWIERNENDRQMLLKKTEEIKEKINSISDIWLR